MNAKNLEKLPCYNPETAKNSCETCYWETRPDNKICAGCMEEAKVCGKDCDKCMWISVDQGKEMFEPGKK